MNNIQINGQRRWGPPENWLGPPPAHGTEIFIKNLPKEVFELELYDIFSVVGIIYEVRLPVNWNGLNRGYAFLRFTSISAADKAIDEFDNYEIRNNRKIKVVRSVDNTRLFLSAVPIDKNAEDLKEGLSNYVENVKKVYVYPTLENRSVFRGYAFVEFETHRDAAIAKRVLTPDVCQGIFDKKCVAAWANPLPFLDQSVLKSLNVLFIRNIPKDISSFHLKQIVENLTKQEIQRIKKLNDFAFLTFKEHKSAKIALNHLKNTPIVILDHETQAEWAVPREMVVSYPEKKFPELGNQYRRSESSSCDSSCEFSGGISDNVFNFESRSGFPYNTSTLQESKNEIFDLDAIGQCFPVKEETLFSANCLKNINSCVRKQDTSDPYYNKQHDYENDVSHLNALLSPVVREKNNFFHSFRSDICNSSSISLPKSSVELNSRSLQMSNAFQKSQGKCCEHMEFSGKFTDKDNLRFSDIMKNLGNMGYPSKRICNLESDPNDTMMNLNRLGVSSTSASAMTNSSSRIPSRTFPFDGQEFYPQSRIEECFFRNRRA